MVDEVDNGTTEEVVAEETPVTETPVETPKPTIEDTARKAVEELEAREKSERARDPATGKFVRTEQTEEPVLEPNPVPEKTAQIPGQPNAKGDSNTLAPPQHWSDASKVRWNKLPRDIQQELLKDAEKLATSSQQAEQVKSEIDFAKSVRQKFDPDRAEMQAVGADESRAIDYLLEMHRFAKRDPQGYLIHAAKALNIDLSKLAQPQQTGETQYVDPELAALKQKLSQLESGFTSLTSQQQQAQQAEINGRIEAFKAQANSDGTPKYPHFDTVRYTMGVLMQSGQAKGMEDAYDMAVYAKPELRAQLLAEQAKRDEEQRKREQAEKVAAAKKAAGTVLSPKATTQVQNGRKKTIEETARETADKIFSAA